MAPKSFSEIEFTHITLETVKGNVEGLFSDMRVDAATIPEGLMPYAIRADGPDDYVPTTIETHVAANFYGTIIVNEPLDFGCSDHIEILDWNFEENVED